MLNWPSPWNQLFPGKKLFGSKFRIICWIVTTF
jgi:hypothetical protein